MDQSYLRMMMKVRHLDQQDSILLLHHYDSDLAHISDLYILVIGLYKSEIWASNIVAVQDIYKHNGG